jgi:hypothetical protein
LTAKDALATGSSSLEGRSGELKPVTRLLVRGGDH